MSVPPDKGLDGISPGKGPESLQPSISSGQASTGFDSYMQGAGTRGGGASQTTGPTPMEIAQGASPISGSPVSLDSIGAQANQMQDSLGTVSKQLNDQNLKLKRPQNHLVRQKLSDANGHIRAAAAKLGLQLQEGKLPSGMSALTRFLAMVNEGQNQLVQVQQQLKKMAASGANINPGEMLSVQVKMGLAQQEIQYTSTLLGKVIQSITQLLNQQL